MIIYLTVFGVLSTFFMLCLEKKYSGCVTIGKLLCFTLVGFLPVVNIIAVVIGLILIIESSGILDKEIF